MLSVVIVLKSIPVWGEVPLVAGTAPPIEVVIICILELFEIGAPSMITAVPKEAPPLRLKVDTEVKSGLLTVAPGNSCIISDKLEACI